MGKPNVSSHLLFICVLGLYFTKAIAMERKPDSIITNEHQITSPSLFAPLDPPLSHPLTKDTAASLNSDKKLPQEPLQRYVKLEPYDKLNRPTLMTPKFEALHPRKASAVSYESDHTSSYSQEVHHGFNAPDSYEQSSHFRPNARLKPEPYWPPDSAGPASGHPIPDGAPSDWSNQHVPYQPSEGLPSNIITDPIWIPSTPEDLSHLLSPDNDQSGLNYFANPGQSVDKTSVAFGPGPTRRTYIDLTGVGANEISEPPADRLDVDSQWNHFEAYPGSHMSGGSPQLGGYEAKMDGMNLGHSPHLNPIYKLYPGHSENRWEAHLGSEGLHGQYGGTFEQAHQNRQVANMIAQSYHEFAMQGTSLAGHGMASEFISPRFSTNTPGNQAGPGSHMSDGAHYAGHQENFEISDMGISPHSNQISKHSSPYENRWGARVDSEGPHGQYERPLNQMHQNKPIADEFTQIKQELVTDDASIGWHGKASQFISPGLSTNVPGYQAPSSQSTHTFGHAWSSRSSISESHSARDSVGGMALFHRYPSAFSNPLIKTTSHGHDEPHTNQMEQLNIWSIAEKERLRKSFKSFFSKIRPSLDLKKKKFKAVDRL